MEDIRETIKTTMRLNEPEQTLQAAKDAAKRLFEVADAILDELAKAGEPKPREDDT